jgi:hypothetical protein
MFIENIHHCRFLFGNQENIFRDCYELTFIILFFKAIELFGHVSAINSIEV